MYHDSLHKSVSHFNSNCCSSPINSQVLFYGGYDIHLDDGALDILRKHNIEPFILKSVYSMHDQNNDNGPKIKLMNIYGNSRMNWMIHHGTLQFTPAHMNSILVKTWESFKLSSTIITQNASKKTPTPPPPLSPPYIDTNHQYCLGVTQQSNREKADEILQISKAIISHIELKAIRKIEPTFILR